MLFYRYESLVITKKVNVRVRSSRLYDFVNDKKNMLMTPSRMRQVTDNDHNFLTLNHNGCLYYVAISPLIFITNQ